MSGVILGLTLRQLVAQRRTLLLVVLAVLPVALALLFRVTGASPETNPDFAPGILAHFIVALVLPLTALVVGTAALGQELEDGTFVYLVAKPLPRWRVVVAKLAAAWLVIVAVVGVSTVVAGTIMLAGHEGDGLVPAFVVAILAGSFAYAALFLGLSVRFGRALVIGLAYVFVWEALISQFIPGVRFLSIRAYTLGIADAVSGSPSRLLDASLDVTPALVLLALVVLASTWYAVRRMEAYQLSERV